jgi:NTE family protein
MDAKCVEPRTYTGEPVLIDRGDAGMAVRASAAVPGAMQPVGSPRGPLVDGGISSLVPVRFARALGAEIVIGVDIYCSSPRTSGTSFLTTLAKVSQTQTCLVSRAEMTEADVLIAPSVSVSDMKSVTQREEAILAGYTIARAAIPTLLNLLDGRNIAKSEGGDLHLVQGACVEAGGARSQRRWRG